MNNKFKTKKGKEALMHHLQIQHFYKNTLSKALYPFSYTVYLRCSIIKARLKKHFSHILPKKPIRVRIIRTLV